MKQEAESILEQFGVDISDFALGKSFSMPQRYFLRDLAAIIEDRFSHPVIVNIGVLLGCSMAWLRAGSSEAILIGIDMDLHRRSPRTALLKYLRATLIEIDSQKACKDFEGPLHPVGTPHLVFVDGGHSYLVAKADFECWSSRLPIGGVIAIHDLHMGQVMKAFSEWYNSDVWQEVEGSPCPGIRAFERAV